MSFRELYQSIARHFSLTVCTNNHVKAGIDVINREFNHRRPKLSMREYKARASNTSFQNIT